MSKNYLVPMWSRENKQIRNHLALIKAENQYQAMLIAIGSHDYTEKDGETMKNDLSNTNWHIDMNYESYRECKNPKEVFTYMDRSVTIETDIDERKNYMADQLYDFMYMGDYNKNISDLAAMALPETWTLRKDDENGILKRYLSKTFERLQEENKIITMEKFCAFNTGLYTNNYEEIFIVAEKSIGTQKEWVFKEFCTEYRLDSTDIKIIPQRADYFSDPSLLLFDWHYPVRVQYGHILDDERNKNRLPQIIQDSKIPLKIFTGVIDTSIKKVIANYKLAVPQYYHGEIQLLIPLYFEDDNYPELALTVTKKDGYYQGHTCITLDMAYNNARLIAKPESNWLSIT